MKIPRLESAPCCYSLQSWAVRIAVSDLLIGCTFAGTFLWLSGELDPTTEAYNATFSVLICIGVFFLIPSCFGLLLYIGLWNPKKCTKLILIYWYYAFIVGILVLVLFIGLGIFILVAHAEESGSAGFVSIMIGIIYSGSIFYNGLVVHSIYMNIKEGQEDKNYE